MVSRREIIGGLVGAAVAPKAAMASTAATSSRAGEPQDEGAEKIQQAVLPTRAELQMLRQTAYSHQSDAVRALREAMRTHLRSHRRLPGYFEVGWGVWIDVYDWHVGTHQQLAVSRLADGRYTLQLMQSTLVLRPDVEDTYISTPFDELERDAAPAVVAP